MKLLIKCYELIKFKPRYIVVITLGKRDASCVTTAISAEKFMKKLDAKIGNATLCTYVKEEKVEAASCERDKQEY